jgi:hypothetical protein
MRLLLLLLAFQPIHAFCSHSPTFRRPEQITSGWKQPSRSPIQKKKPVPSSLVTLRGGGDEFVGQAYDWCINLGAPAALVAGALIATIYENIRVCDLEVKRGDTPYVKYASKLCCDTFPMFTNLLSNDAQFFLLLRENDHLFANVCVWTSNCFHFRYGKFVAN